MQGKLNLVCIFRYVYCLLAEMRSSWFILRFLLTHCLINDGLLIFLVVDIIFIMWFLMIEWVNTNVITLLIGRVANLGILVRIGPCLTLNTQIKNFSKPDLSFKIYWPKLESLEPPRIGSRHPIWTPLNISIYCFILILIVQDWKSKLDNKKK